MRFVITLEVRDRDGKGTADLTPAEADHLITGPIATGIIAMNNQIEAEGRDARLKLISCWPTKRLRP